MTIKRKTLYILGVLALLVILMTTVSLFIFFQKDSLRCISSTTKNKQCGQVSLGTPRSYFVNGIVESKMKKGNDLIVNIKTLNNLGKNTLIPAVLPPPQLPFGYIETKIDANNISSKVAPEITREEFFEKIQIGEEYKINFYIATKQEIIESKSKFGESTFRYLDCNPANKVLLNNLTKASILTPFVNLFNQATSDCPTYIPGWEKI